MNKPIYFAAIIGNLLRMAADDRRRTMDDAYRNPQLGTRGSNLTRSVVRRLSSVVSLLLIAAACVAVNTTAAAQAEGRVSRPQAREFYVAPNGTSWGDGSRSQPWDLQTALNRPSSLQAGDTIWLRGGTYRGAFYSRLNGTPELPIYVRGYQGERATIDKASVSSPDSPLYVAGSYTWYRDFEVTNTNPERVKGSTYLNRSNAISVFGRDNKFINLIVHDAECGFGFWKDAESSEIYGSVVYNNGIVDNGTPHGHGIYTDNVVGTKRIEDSIIFNNFSYGIHAYSEAESLNGYHIEGNVSAVNGMPTNEPQGNILISSAFPASRIELLSNHAYYPLNTGENGINLRIGGWGSTDISYVARGNYFAGGYWSAYGPDWESSEFTGNTLHVSRLFWQLNARSVNVESRLVNNNRYLYSGSGSTQFKYHGSLVNFSGWRSASGFDPGSSYSTSLPSAPEVIVRPNRYELGRANIAVWNWPNQSSVSVNLDTVLNYGARYEVRNAFDYFAAPVATGIYNGSSVSVPMTNLNIATPIGWSSTTPSTAPRFGAFVVRTLACAGTIEFSRLRAAYGSQAGEPNYDPVVDYNTDNRIDILDYMVLRSRFGTC